MKTRILILISLMACMTVIFCACNDFAALPEGYEPPPQVATSSDQIQAP